MPARQRKYCITAAHFAIESKPRYIFPNLSGGGSFHDRIDVASGADMHLMFRAFVVIPNRSPLIPPLAPLVPLLAFPDRAATATVRPARH